MRRSSRRWGLLWIPYLCRLLFLSFVARHRARWRFVLFPPLGVIGFESFAHPAAGPGAARPFALMAACGLTVSAG